MIESLAYPLAHRGPSPVEYPRLVPDLPPVGGRIRVEPEDFQVEEIPLYEFCGEGEHCYITLAKTNRTTLQVREYLSRRFRVSEEDIGFAGFKDRRAVTQQTFSVPGISNDDVQDLDRDWLEVRAVTRHTNKLRTGHLSGNRFTIRVRETHPDSLETARQVVDRVQRIGLPNFYGPQRFGFFGDSYRVGCALLHRDPREAIEVLLGPREGTQDEYRTLFGEGKYAQALAALPPGCRSEAAILNTLRRYPGNFRAAARRIPHQMKRMFFSAYQAYLFNWCLRERMEWGPEAFGVPEEGDLAFIHRNGACFLVEDADEARRRAEEQEISPSGPVFGRKMKNAEGREGRMEQSVLDSEKLRPRSFLSHVKGLRLDGSRRSYRIPLGDVGVTAEDATTLVFTFTLPPGSYATLLLDQVMGCDPDPERHAPLPESGEQPDD